MPPGRSMLGIDTIRSFSGAGNRHALPGVSARILQSLCVCESAGSAAECVSVLSFKGAAEMNVKSPFHSLSLRDQARLWRLKGTD